LSFKLTIKTKICEIFYRGINEFKKGYQPRINIIKDENGNLIADPQNVLNRWKNSSNQVLNVYGVHEVRQMDIHMAEPLVAEPSLVKAEIALRSLKRYKSLSTDKILFELIKAGGKYYGLRYTNLLVLVVYGIRRNCHSSGRNLLLYQFSKMVIRPIVITIEESPSYLLPTKFYQTFFQPG
jgi:hypothetical protein